MLGKTLNISTSPHLTKGISVEVIMRNVVYALMPTALFSVYSFGINAALVLITAVTSSLLTEHFLCRITKKSSTVSDWSAVITGLLLGLTLPPIFPLWMTFLGGMVAIAMGKFLFGGLGYNVFNPALVGRAVLQAAFPVAITTWYAGFMDDRFSTIHSSILTLPFMEPIIDGFSGATPLSAFKFDGVTTDTTDLALGLTSGSAGETSAVLILLGGTYLVIRNFMNWRIPIAILITVLLFSGILYWIDPGQYPSPFFMLFSGGLMLGAVFMATDMVASPITSAGVILYGVIIGVLVVVIRIWGGLPEGVMYAILLANAMSPHIDRLIQYRVYGTKTKTS
ncbi:RnfABCDGE type electron transport complex subunit D [Fulvivirga lutimaris]|uniref:RnfABCDGE type electron transport complex subunit D n=1 Tax=Fulvivirga lutimaris TaxID=1819566 RepID=UPI0012BBF5DC|nr:RnfABCDGE type electron transport complex subunit D [Fulvivirga lutimaris]MTI41656.1 RnfABCDGE type electron transport complex subunit D [Fulvivirga lutimaris]